MIKDKKFLERVVVLQEFEVRTGTSQFSNTFPTDLVNVLGLKKGDKLLLRYVVGDDEVTIKKKTGDL